MNPIDYHQRDHAFPPLAGFPSVLGFDIAGVVAAIGSSVSNAPESGTRVAAFAPYYFYRGDPDHGAFQKFTVVPAVNVTPIPNAMTFNEASLLPMAVLTTWLGFESIGFSRHRDFRPADKQGIIVWGGASSVGSAVIQTARIIGFTVYTAASEKHSTYLKSLGATHVFDYKNPDVVSKIAKSAKADGVSINWGFDAVGQLPLSASVLSQTKTSKTAKLASAVSTAHVPGWEAANFPGVDVTFVSAPEDKARLTEHCKFVFNMWLKEKLAEGLPFVPSPKIKIVPGGLKGLNEGLDLLRAGVSGEKIVLEI